MKKETRTPKIIKISFYDYQLKEKELILLFKLKVDPSITANKLIDLINENPSVQGRRIEYNQISSVSDWCLKHKNAKFKFNKELDATSTLQQMGFVDNVGLVIITTFNRD